ncbi:MAG: hypothetical protein HKM94_07755, partial [Halobacteria archaeon]|nr:hypothetical protein [Halobacteria archaeon]
MPAAELFLETTQDDDFWVNSCRVPLRIGVDWLINGTPESRIIADRMANWIDTGQTFTHIVRPGYHLDGTYEAGWNTLRTAFIAPMGVAAMTGSPTLLNDIYAKVRTEQDDYYDDCLNLLSMLIMGNTYFDPTVHEARAQVAPFYPLGFFFPYTTGHDSPTNYNFQQRLADIKTFYDYWLTEYVIDEGLDGSGNQMYRVPLSQSAPDDAQTVSEGIGYGMLIMVHMAGYETSAQEYFDGYWYFAKDNPSPNVSTFMDWKVPETGTDESKTSGDLDMAAALILAHHQWGSNSGTVNYQAEAIILLDALYQYCVGGGAAPDTVNQRPNVSAGPDKQVIFPATISLVGTATDDGLPSGTLTYEWSLFSGFGQVTFTTPNATTTNMQVSGPGVYVVKFIANDGLLWGEDTAT